MKNYFYGQYFKCQGEKTLAVIPAYHKTRGKTSCSVQLIADGGAWCALFPFSDYKNERRRRVFRIGENSFGETGVTLNIKTADVTAVGSVSFGALSPIKYDIMGPFKYVPFMQCRHSVISMAHSVNGKMEINGEPYIFDNAIGYIEGDSGYSFPSSYAWTQCFFNGGSLMLSIADIPLGAVRFTGIIGTVMIRRKEYRIATYLGAKVLRIGNGEVAVCQKDMKLTAKLVQKNSHPLRAPVCGAMTRTVHESAVCTASYIFEKNGQVLLEFTSDKASFEYEYPR